MKWHGHLFAVILVVTEAGQSLARPAPGAAASVSRIAKGPYLTGLSDSTVDVRLELDSPAAATLEMTREGTTPPSPPRSFQDAAATLHSFRVTGLEAAAQYSYVVRVATGAIAKGRFTTASKPNSGATVRFLVYGDTRSDPAAHTALVGALASIPSDFLVNTGDLVQDGASATDWQSFFDAESPLLCQRPIFACIGNHELYNDAAGANFARYFGFVDNDLQVHPYGTVRIGSVRFFFLSGSYDWGSGSDRQWLEGALAAADDEAGVAWRIAVVHHGPWSSGPHGPNESLVEARIPELLAAHKIDLVLSGHDHIYERGNSGMVKYIISGGGGAPLYPVGQPLSTTRKAEAAHHFVEVVAKPDGIGIVAHRQDGSVMDECGFAKSGPWDCDSAQAVGSSASAEGSESLHGARAVLARYSFWRHGCETAGASVPAMPPWPVLVFVLSGVALASRRARRS
jgi:3',5'-cyclic AMP phosphodiesterase CpdA